MRPVIGLTTSQLLGKGSPTGDRFTIAAPYCRAIAAVGGAPILIPVLGDVEAAIAIFPLLDGLLLTGGVDVHPARYGQEIHPGCEDIDEDRDATELALIAEAQATDIPVFGICRGIQMMNVGFGGTLIQDIPRQRSGAFDHRASIPAPSQPSHDITITPGSLLAESLGTEVMPANSLHHQAVDDVAPGFTVTARSADGIVEAIEHPGHRFLAGVQCHPERLFEQDERWLGLFGAFVQAAGRMQTERRIRTA